MKAKSSISKRVSKTRKPVSKKADTKKKRKVSSENLLNSREGEYWQSQFILTEHWKSDLDFFTDELKFLQRLMDKYFVWISDDKLIESARKIAAELTRFKKRRADGEKQLAEHQRHLTNLVVNPFSHDAQECKKEHETLEQLIADVAKDFRAVKKEVFQLAEILDAEQAKPLLQA